jgi:hypothetical protein
VGRRTAGPGHTGSVSRVSVSPRHFRRSRRTSVPSPGPPRRTGR